MLLFNILLVIVIDGMEDCAVVLKGAVVGEEIILLVDGVLILSAAMDDVKLNPLLDVTLEDVTDDVVVSSLLDNVFIEVTNNVEGGLLLNIELLNTVDGREVIALLEVTLVEKTDDVEIIAFFDVTLVTVIDVAEVISALFDIILVEVTDNEGYMVDTSLVDVTEGIEVEVTDNELVCSLLDITLVDVTDVVSSLLDKVLMEATDNVEDSSLLDTSLLTVADGVVIIRLLEMTLVEETDSVEISVLLKATLLTVIDVAEVILALFDITLVDVRDKEGAVSNGSDNVVVDTELVNIIDVEEYCSLCDSALVGRADVVELISLSITVLEEAMVCTDVI